MKKISERGYMRFLLFLLIFFCIKISIYSTSFLLFLIASLVVSSYSIYYIIMTFKLIRHFNKLVASDISFIKDKNHYFVITFLYFFLISCLFVLISIYWFRMDFIVKSITHYF